MCFTDCRLKSFQFRIRASDQRSPVEQTNEASVRIAISRDEQPPEFLAEPYFALISENTAVNETVTRVVASDSDLQGRLQYEVRGVAPGSDYFSIEKNTGTIKVAKPLNDQTATSYTVSIHIDLLKKFYHRLASDHASCHIPKFWGQKPKTSIKVTLMSHQ